MAEKAQQEPTMEEILSSIRKIISDDGPAQETPSATEASEEPVGFEMREEETSDLGDLAFDDEDTFEPNLPETESDMLDALTAEPEADALDAFEVAEEPTLEAFDELPPLDDLSSFDVEEPQDEGIVEAPAFEAAEPEPQAEPMTFEIEAPEPEFEPEPVETPSFAEEPAPMASSSLTDDKIADAAAGSLSKLLSQVEFGEEAGGNNTIEGLVREMLRPMLKEWLDENLSSIVDRHVEAEVKRISRRAG